MKDKSEAAVVLGNVYDKYTSRNPFARLLFHGYLRALRELVDGIRAESILEVGCGEGRLARILANWKPEARVAGVDLAGELFDDSVRQSSRIDLSVQSAYSLGFPDDSFDLVIAAEVLEHLEDPEAALREIHRVARRWVALSVPNEPTWRLLNLARLAYLGEWGNTPGHLQHWSSRRFSRLVEGFLRIEKVRKPLPWTMILAVKVDNPT